MLKNYIKTAIRTLSRQKSNAVINISGLAVGFASFLLIFLVVQYHESFDNFHTKKDRLYRVVRVAKDGGENNGTVPTPAAAALRAEVPQIANAADILADNNAQVIIAAKNGAATRRFDEVNGVFVAEPQFFQMFDFGLAEGAPATAISEPYTVLLTKATALKYFGDWKGAVGKVLKVDGTNVTVSGILNDPPVNTDFPLKAVLSYSTLKSIALYNTWDRLYDGNYCFIQLAAGQTPASLKQALAAFTDRHIRPVNPTYNLALQPLSGIHYDERYGNYNGRTFSKNLILALNLIGLFLLIIACVNFVNLTIAQAVSRSREVGVRKVLGGRRLQLVMQFLGETAVTTFLAMAVSIMIVLLVLPAVNNLLDIHLAASALYSVKLIIFLFCALIAVSFLSGFYPALVLSGFRIINVLKGGAGTNPRQGASFRKGLVVFQFVIAQALIIGTLVVSSQMSYFRNTDMGFRKEAVIYAGFPQDSSNNSRLSYLKNELEKIPGVKMVSFSMYSPADKGGFNVNMKIDGSRSSYPYGGVSFKGADAGYFSLYRLPFVAGRPYFASDTMREYVVNETVVKKMGIADPKDAIGRSIEVWGKTLPIVGVVKDFHTGSLRDQVGPVVMTTAREYYQMVSLQIDPGKTGSITARMENLWSSDFPEFMFEYHFMDQTIADYYKQEDQLSQLYKIFAGIAIFISCLGLYGLISYMAIQRRKEIGIRKVLGAPVKDILFLLSKEFTLLVVIAFLIATPLAWYGMHQWLQAYAYHIHMGVAFFAATILSSLCIAWLTVGYTAIKAATANPVNSLKTE